MPKKILVATVQMGDDYTTQVTGNTIEEIIEKIKDYHTMSNFEREHLEKRGRLKQALKSGWYLKETEKV